MADQLRKHQESAAYVDKSSLIVWYWRRQK
jgi:hypothetical protein